MMFITRYNILMSVIVLQAWSIHTVKSEENQMTRHEGHSNHDTNKMRWDHWTDWTACSVDCGRGITTRSRECRSMLDGLVTEGCSGRSEEIKICEFTGCLREADEVIECKKLESRVFGGKRYRWKPYTHPRQECKQACRPIGAAFYLEIGKNVSDGSLCGKDGSHVCIGGKCKTVGCDNIVESDTKHDNCGVCGGDSSSCIKVSKTFSDSVKFGYHTIGTIPRGATNILISEAVGARNYLGVRATDKSFSINTDFRLSRFGDIPGAGTIFKYTRQAGPECPDECIRSDGPIDVSLDIVVLFYSNNKGISYSYFMPSDFVDHMDKEEGSQNMVHIDGGSIPGKLGDEDSRVKEDKKRPIFSSDFKFKKNSRRRKHRKHHKRNRNRENESGKSGSINVTGETGALHKHKTKTQSTVTNNNEKSFIITYKNDSIIIESGRTKPDNSKNVHENNNQNNKVDVDTTTRSNKQYDPTDSFIEQNGRESGPENEGEHNGIVEDAFEEKPKVSEAGEEDQEKVDNVDVEEKIDGKSDEEEDNVDGNIQDKSTESPGAAPPASVTDADMYTNDNREPSLYSWIISGYTECSQTCGKGKQSPILLCIVTDKQAGVDDSFCSDIVKPSTAVLECSNGECPPSWNARPWSKCSVTCGFGTQSREYVCLGPNGEGLTDFECGSPKPDMEERTCDLGSCAYGWYYTEWEKECVAHCGYGTLSRRVHCSSDSGNINTACNQRDKPEETKSCRNDDCGGFWVTGPWSKCNATCGMAYQTRPVACAAKQRDRVIIVSKSACQDEERPATYMSCDLEPCGPRWYMADWGDCAVTCGSGQRSRDVRCLDDKFKPSSDCDKDLKPAEQEECTSNRPCPLSDESIDKPEKKTKPAKPKETPAKQDESSKQPDCEDKFSQCKMVLKNRLCQYKYYQKICCGSCANFRKKL